MKQIGRRNREKSQYEFCPASGTEELFYRPKSVGQEKIDSVDGI
jgi:hypothetical protein